MARMFWISLFYFLALSSLGYLALKLTPLRGRNYPGDNEAETGDFDLVFTSVSASTVSSMSTVEMEAFSNAQLIAMTLLMLVGGEMFTSIVHFHFMKSKKIAMIVGSAPARAALSLVPADVIGGSLQDARAAKCLAAVAAAYFLLCHALGALSIFVYASVVPGARRVLEEKGISRLTFSLFTVVSSFSNCGFVPTNENMIAFRTDAGLLLVVAAQVLAGKVLLPPLLRAAVWAVSRCTRGRVHDDLGLLLRDPGRVGYRHLLPRRDTLLLLATAAAFTLGQAALFCALEWRSGAVAGMSARDKIVAGVFLAVNARHAGESVVDLSALSPAILVVYIVMMYLPAYTIFNPTSESRRSKQEDQMTGKSGGASGLCKALLMSPLSTLAAFVILVCITERKKLEEDPLNFNALNITLEVISAYGNVGFSTGYSCARRIRHDGACEDKWFGFVGKWSTAGKMVLILVMFYGRLKKFSVDGGRAWKLL